MIDTLKLASKQPMESEFVIIGNAGNRRIKLFQEALARVGQTQARLVRWIDLLNGATDLRDVITPASILRIESPGQNFDVTKALLGAGADVCNEFPDFPRLPLEAIADLQLDKGRLLWPRQWFVGFRRVLLKLDGQLRHAGEHRLMQSIGGIVKMFDKPYCHDFLEKSSISVPPALRALDGVRSFAELSEKLRANNWHRVFMKLAHGSSASGVIAYETNGRRHRATTTVEMVQKDGECLLYNSRRLFIYEDVHQIERLVDALSLHRIHVEQWIPKAGINGKTFDLRVVTIAGRARHVVVRLSRGPMTNLHLLNDRDTADAVRKRMGESAWHEAMTTCERVAACFPDSLYCGIDLLIAVGFQRHAVAEVNAFGDLLPGAMSDGVDTYTAEILAMTALLPC
jgi:hypothetical protein